MRLLFVLSRSGVSIHVYCDVARPVFRPRGGSSRNVRSVFGATMNADGHGLREVRIACALVNVSPAVLP